MYDIPPGIKTSLHSGLRVSGRRAAADVACAPRRDEVGGVVRLLGGGDAVGRLRAQAERLHPAEVAEAEAARAVTPARAEYTRQRSRAWGQVARMSRRARRLGDAATPGSLRTHVKFRTEPRRRTALELRMSPLRSA